METNDRKRELVLLDSDEFESLIDKLYLLCEKWLLGEETGDRLLAEHDEIMNTHWEIRGLGGQPDDFDWSTVPVEKMKHGDKLYSRFNNVSRLMIVVAKAVNALQVTGKETTINRAYYFGKYSQELSYAPER